MLFKIPVLVVLEVLGEFVWWSYWRGLVGLVLFAEGGNFVPEMEEMFVRRLVVVLWKRICSSCLIPFDSGLFVCVLFVGVSCLESFCVV